MLSAKQTAPLGKTAPLTAKAKLRGNEGNGPLKGTAGSAKPVGGNGEIELHMRDGKIKRGGATRECPPLWGQRNPEKGQKMRRTKAAPHDKGKKKTGKKSTEKSFRKLTGENGVRKQRGGPTKA